MELVIIAALSLLMVPLVVFTDGPVRLAVSLPFVLFFPGYTLTAALFPRKGSLHSVARLALSFGLSLAVVSLTGLALNTTPWGIRLHTTLASLLLLIVATAAIGWRRRRRLLPQERFEPRLRPDLAYLSRSWAQQGQWDRLVTVLLIAAVAALIGTAAYAVATPRTGERFTEFYILGTQGRADRYPRDVLLGEKLSVVVGIVNREHEAAVYRVQMTFEGTKVGELGPVLLDHEGKWEQQTTFVASRQGRDQQVEFRLYKGEGSEPYRTLHLWVSVTPGG